MAWLNRIEVQSIPEHVYFQVKCCFHNELFKNGPSPGAFLVLAFSQNQDFPRNKLLQRVSRTLEELLSGVSLTRR
jgi:hypothetical protein